MFVVNEVLMLDATLLLQTGWILSLTIIPSNLFFSCIADHSRTVSSQFPQTCTSYDRPAWNEMSNICCMTKIDWEQINSGRLNPECHRDEKWGIKVQCMCVGNSQQEQPYIDGSCNTLSGGESCNILTNCVVLVFLNGWKWNWVLNVCY